MQNKNKQLLITAVSLVVLAMISRLVPHYPNFTAVGALAIFSGSVLNDKRIAYILPLVTMLLTDMILGFHSTFLVVYASILIGVFVGSNLLQKVTMPRIAGVALINAIQFFIITNFGIWAFGSYYTKDVTGLITCFTAAIPFFGYSFVGDLFFSGVLFGTYQVIASKVIRVQAV